MDAKSADAAIPLQNFVRWRRGGSRSQCALLQLALSASTAQVVRIQTVDVKTLHTSRYVPALAYQIRHGFGR